MFVSAFVTTKVHMSNTPPDIEVAENPDEKKIGHCASIGFSTPIVSIPELFFDVTSASANWAAGSGANKAHAIGSIFHGIGAAWRYGGYTQFEKRAANYNAANFIAGGEIMELGAIVSTLDGWRKIVSATWLAIGTLVISKLWLDERGPLPDIDAYQRVGYGMQVIYLVIVVIAATEDWKRLLWLLPEVPFETMTLTVPTCFRTDNGSN